MRRTKIVATVGPACDSREKLQALISAGVNVFRLNFSHGTADEHRQRASLIRELAAAQNRHVALLGDLQGPKIRLRQLAVDVIRLEEGDELVLDTALSDGEGDASQVGVDYQPLADSVAAGDILLLDDGRIRLEVLGVSGTAVRCRADSQGELKSRKGINRLGGGLSAPALTEKDIKDIDVAAELELDYLAVSFPSCPGDIDIARGHMEKAGCEAAVIGKIERAEAVASDAMMDSIILACDGIMVARGDLGVEVGDAQLMALQKHLIKRARILNRTVITATQMMESMTHSPVPTRAEVFDVANAVLDGTDAVMLSAETASGDYPVETVEAMAGACTGAEQYPSMLRSGHRLDRKFESRDESIAMAAMYAANHHVGVAAIVALTETGRSPLLMSRLSSGLPIIALSRDPRTCRRCALYRGVTAIHFDVTELAGDAIPETILANLVAAGRLKAGDDIIFTFGDRVGVDGYTNTLKILTA